MIKEVVVPEGEYCNGCKLLDTSGLCNDLCKMLVVEGKQGIPVDYSYTTLKDRYKVLKDVECQR